MNNELSEQNAKEQVLKGWTKFQELILKESTKVIIPLIDDYKDELAEVLWNHLFDTGESTSISRNISRDERYINKTFFGYSEISSSMRTLEDIEVYINSFPYRNKKIIKLRNLSYHIENYFSELYILRERINKYLKQIRKSFKKDNNRQSIVSITNSFLIITERVFSEPTKTRGRHIHETRFQDNEIRRLESLELLKLVNDGELKRIISPYFNFDYLLLKNKWKRRVKRMNVSFRKYLDAFGGLLVTHLFDEENRSIYPNSPKD